MYPLKMKAFLDWLFFCAKALPVLQDGTGVSILPQLTQKVKRKPNSPITTSCNKAKFCYIGTKKVETMQT